ncbi:hypothetical protein [Rhizocola hellebori]|uniref:hypothetical protein n=1 Tax=Rhizocola hellebori TaxID=1392758 RepID=UPI0019440021|nr:hypothetical protein [Rhizocola hellebori]
MTTTPTTGGFTGDLADAFTPPSGGGCCGSAPSTAAPADASAASPCCGTAADAQAAGSCCGAAAKAEAVATGQGCCG